MDLKYKKIRFKNPEHRVQVQEWLFSQGCEWITSGRKLVNYPDDFGLYVDYDGKITRISSESVFKNNKCEEIEIPSELTYEIY